MEKSSRKVKEDIDEGTAQKDQVHQECGMINECFVPLQQVRRKA